MLPALQQADLDPATLDALFADLQACAEVLSVMPRTTRRACSGGVTIPLATARAGLRDGTFGAVQIRYRFEGRGWCDTLVALPDSCARIVRVCADDAVQSIAALPAV